MQWGTARGSIPSLAGMAAEVFAARRGQRSPTVPGDSVAVVALSTPMRLRLSDFAADLMPETHAEYGQPGSHTDGPKCSRRTTADDAGQAMGEPRTAVITGASRGLGFASAVHLYYVAD